MVRKDSNPGQMLILDSSAIVAAMLREPGHQRILERIDAATSVGVAAPIVVETAIVISSRLRLDARPQLREFLQAAEVEVIPFTSEHMDSAIDAFLRYRKGRHPAALNFGDCLSYASATIAGLPLLFTGSDFLKTDVTPA
jgi:ribonuclease VapC